MPHAAPAIAKSPLRRANSSMAKPAPGDHTGNRAEITRSPGSTAVMNGPRKNSRAGTHRTPLALRISISASRVTATVGHSAAASA